MFRAVAGGPVEILNASENILFCLSRFKHAVHVLQIFAINSEVLEVCSRKVLRQTSVATLKPANGGQGKTGQRRWPGLSCFYPAHSPEGKFVFVRQLRGPHLST